jgi:hypothetical protein
VRALAIRHSTALPIREISALTTRPRESGADLLAVGDEDFAVIAAALDADHRPDGTWRHDLCQVLPREYLEGDSGSGFEGIACDGEGTIFVLQEEEARILVLSADLKELLQTITLSVPEDEPGYGAAWRDTPNARGEGLALLTGGHVLIAKQKRPVYLIEFGPAGDDSSGIGPDTMLPRGAAFDRPAGDAGTLVPLLSWPLGENASRTLPTVNDIAFGEDQRVYLISAEEHTIARLEKRLEPGERVRTDGEWKIDGDLPGGNDARPEGLALVGGSRPAIGIDTKVAGDNILLLAALD